MEKKETGSCRDRQPKVDTDHILSAMILQLLQRLFCLLCGEWIGGTEHRKQKAIWETTAGILAEVMLAVAMERCWHCVKPLSKIKDDFHFQDKV